MSVNRKFFVSILLAGLLSITPAESRFPRGGSGGTSGFLGNPNANISSVSGSITASRTSCVTPCFIQVSGSAVTASGSTDPYADVEYSWNFGDPSGTEVFTRPTDGASVNANNTQVAPDAAYVYRNVGTGTYTVTMTPRYMNAGVVTTGTPVTQNITVSDFSPQDDYYFDSTVAGPGSGSFADPFKAITGLNALITAGRIQRFNFAQGSNWTGSVGINIPNSVSSNYSNLRFRSYVGAGGAGAKPIINVSSGIEIPLQLGNPSTHAKDDIVISGLYLTNSGTNGGYSIASSSGGAAATGTMSNVYLDNCDLVNTLRNTSFFNLSLTTESPGNIGTVVTNHGVWGGSVVSPIFTSGNLSSGTSATVTSGTTIQLTNNPGGGPVAIDLSGLVTSAGPSQSTISLHSSITGDTIFRISAFTGSGTTTPTVTLDATPSGTLSQWEIGAPKTGAYGGAANWMFYFGVAFSGSGSNSTLDHHIYPDIKTHGLYSWNTFGATGTGNFQRSFGINANWNSTSAGLEYVRYTTISQNVFGVPVGSGTSTQLMHDGAQSSPGNTAVFTGTGGSPSANITYTTVGSTSEAGAPQVGQLLYFQTQGTLPTGFTPMTEYCVKSVSGTNPYTITLAAVGCGSAIVVSSGGTGSHTILNVGFKDWVTQGNFAQNLTGDAPVQFSQGFTHTFRDNRITGLASGRWYSPATQSANALGPKVYRNKFYIPSTATNANNTNAVAAIELTYSNAPTAWPAAVQVTDNIIYDQRTGAQAVGMSFADAPANGSIVTRNQYYAPNSPSSGTQFMADVATRKLFSDWQAQFPLSTDSKLSASPWSTVPPVTWGDMNFLLKRDLDPASNDNDPMWLEKAA